MSCKRIAFDDMTPKNVLQYLHRGSHMKAQNLLNFINKEKG